jgi:hypothetical protein
MTVFKFLWLSPPEAAPDDSFFNQQVFPHEICSVQHGDSSPAFPLRGHFHKSNAPRLAVLPILDNLDGHDASGFREMGFEFGFGGLEREIRYINLLIHIFAPRTSLFAETLGTQ